MKTLVVILLALSVPSAFAADEFRMGGELPAKRSAPAAKSINLRFEPHWLILTELALDAQFRMGENFSIGPTFSYMFAGDGIFYGPKVAHYFVYDDKTTRPSFGVRGAYYFMGVDRHSLYLAGFARYSKTTITREADSLSGDLERKGDFSETAIGSTVGFQWVLSAITFNAGLGLASYNHPDTVSLRAADGSVTDVALGSGDGVSLTIDAGMGFRF